MMMGDTNVKDWLPDVTVVFPDDTKKEEEGMRKSSLDEEEVEGGVKKKEVHRQDGGGGGFGRSRSPLKQNTRDSSKRSVKSGDPSTNKTATTCSMSSHSPVESADDVASSHSEEARIEEARMELVGSKNNGSDSGSSSSVKKTYDNVSQQQVDQFRDGLVSQNTMRRILANDTEEDMKQVVKAMESEHRAEGEIRVAKTGLVSRNTMLNLRTYRSNKAEVDSNEANEVSSTGAARPRRSMSQTELDQLNDESLRSWEVDEDSPEVDEAAISRPFTNEGEIRQVRKGLVSQQTVRRLTQDEDEPVPVREKEDTPTRQMSQREMRMFQRGCASRKSIVATDDETMKCIKRVPSRVSFEAKEEKNTVGSNKVIIAAAKKRVSEDDDENAGMLVFSNKELQRPGKLDVLTEGQYFLGISMLVYMYSNLRETCRMGHTRCNMHDVDTHSVQSQYKGGEVTAYLSSTKTAGSIIRLVIDELEDSNEDDAEHEIVGGESKEYERQQTAQFRKWIDDSRISQMDEETEQMLLEMKRKVARHRWKRAISAVRLSYRISGGKPPKWENPVIAPGCENCNRFVDMNEMMNETMRKQPKYFKEGSVMNVSRKLFPGCLHLPVDINLE